MASNTPGHIALDNTEYVLVDETYSKQIQTSFNPRFSTGDPNLGDLSFFQFIAMEDFSGGSGQEIFEINNRFFESEGIDVTKVGEMKLAPKVERLFDINAPEKEQISNAVEPEDAWPQVIEWLGQAVIYNDKIEFDAGGVDFLEVFETEILRDKVVQRDTSGNAGTISNDNRAEILSISKLSGLPGDTFKVSVRFTGFELEGASQELIDTFDTNAPNGATHRTNNQKVAFKIYFGGDDARQSELVSKQEIEYDLSQGPLRFIPDENNPVDGSLADLHNPTRVFFKDHNSPAAYLFRLDGNVVIDFIIKVPEVDPGIYKLWTSVEWAGRPFTLRNNELIGSDSNKLSDFPLDDWSSVNLRFQETGDSTDGPTSGPFAEFDDATNANVQFFVESVSEILVERKNLYAPQLKAATVVGSKLVGGRVFDGTGFIEVYEKQNESVDRTLQIDLTNISGAPNPPTYMEMVGSNDIIIIALNNTIYKVDIKTSGLTDAQRVTEIGDVPGDYVSGMAIWNQRIYIASFDKSSFNSHITWTNESEIEGSYAIDGKFWITDLANFKGALFYAGGTQTRKGIVRLFPSEEIMELEHPTFDNRVRTLNAGRFLYFGWSHGTGLGVITERGASTWAIKDLGESIANVVWDIEEVGDKVYFLADGGFFRTTSRFIEEGFLETSEMGGNTPLIDKDWDSVRIELKNKLVGGQKVRVFATNANILNDSFILLGEMTEADSIHKEFALPDDFTSQWIKLRITMITDADTSTPILKRVLIKYVPSTLQKLQWTMAIRCDSNLKLLNGKQEKRKGKQIADDLFALRNKAKIVLRDIDETQHTVVLSDIKQTAPIINKDDLESIISLELLEA